MGFSLTPFPCGLSLSEIVIMIPMGILISYLLASYSRACDYVQNVDLHMSQLQWELQFLTLTRNITSRLIYTATAVADGEAHTEKAKEWGDEIYQMEGSCLRIVREYNNNSSRGIPGKIKLWRISKRAKAAVAEAKDILAKNMLLETLRFEIDCLVRAKQPLCVVVAE